MNRARARRVLATVATTALLTLPTSAALAAPPDHANANPNATTKGQSDAAPGRSDHDRSSTTEDEDTTNEVGASAHPSGRDRTDHQDTRQGNSPSDPDGDGRGPDRNDTGVDKPGDDGGVQNGDQDGNNGCGNDQDFEDDNEGWCLGGRDEPADHPGSREDEIDGGTESTAATTADDSTNEGSGEQTDVAGVQVVAEGVEDTAVAPTVEDQTVEVAGLQVAAEEAGDVAVLGIALERPMTTADTTDALGAPVPEGPLPIAGASLLALGLGGLASVGTGAALRRRGAR